MNMTSLRATLRVVLRNPSPRHVWSNLGLSTKMTLLVAVGLVALVAIFSFLTISASRETTDRALQERVILARLAASHMDHVLGDVEMLLRAVAADAAVPGADVRQALDDGLSRSGSALSQFFLTDGEGRVVASAPVLTMPMALTSSQVQVLRSKDFSIVTMDLPAIGPTVVAAVPVAERVHGEPGILFASVNLAWPEMSDFFQSVELGNTGYLEIVDEHGFIMLSTQPGQVLAQADHGNSLVSMINAGRPNVATCHACHTSAQGAERTPQVMAFAPLKRVPWGAVIRQSEEEAFASSNQLLGRIVLVGILAATGAMILVWLTMRSLVVPVQQLTEAAGRIGAGDLETPIGSRGRDEIATLSRTLDDMRERLRRNIAEIQALNQDLDDRVRERTRECLMAQEALLQRNRALSILNAVAVAVTQPLRLEELLGKALEEVLRLTGIAVGAVFLLEDETAGLELKVYRGVTEQAAQSMIRLHLGDGACGGVLEKGEPVVVPDLRYYRAGAGALLREAGVYSLVHVPLVTRGTSLGTLCVASLTQKDFPPEEVELLMAIGNQIAVGVENARLYTELARKERLRGELLQKVITAQEEERKRIARDLHDDTSQALTALIYSLEAAEGRSKGETSRARLAAMRQLATQTLEGVHKLIFDLRPSVLDHLGLFVALRWYAETRLQPLGIRLRLEEEGTTRRLPSQIETALFRVGQEAINNVVRHSGARNVRLRLHCDDTAVAVDLEDDGIGFDRNEVSRSADRTRGLGLVGMEERVGLLGGEIRIVSELGRGTSVSIRIPLAAAIPAVPAMEGVR